MQKTIQHIYDLLPCELKNAPVFKDLLNSNRILYDFGNTLNIQGRVVHSFGAVESQELRILYLAVFLADQFLPTKKRDEWLKKISNRSRHQDYLFEMRPLLELKAGSTAEHEVLKDQNDEEGKNIDWKIQNGGLTVLLEMKNRIKPMINHLEDIMRVDQDYYDGIPASQIKPATPPSNVKSLFRYRDEKVEDKFIDRKNKKCLQGVWINTLISEDQKKLKDYFDEQIDSQKIQFVILSGWEDQARILTRERSQKFVLSDLFGLTETSIKNSSRH